MPRKLSEDEFNALKAKVIASLPPNLTEDEFNRIAPTRFEQALGEAENTPATPEGSALSRFVGGAVDVLNPLTALAGIGQAVVHPIDTATNLVRSQAQQFQKAAAAPTLSEKVGYTAAGVTPLLGPAMARAGETIASGDIAGGLGQTAGLVAPTVVEGLLRGRAPAQPDLSKADILERQAQEQVSQRVLAPGNPKFKGKAAAIAPELLQRGLTGDRDALRQIAQEGMDEAGSRIDDAIQAAGGVKAPVSVNEVVQNLKGSIADLQDSAGNPLSGQAAQRINALTDRIRQLQSLAGKTGTVTFEDLRKIRDENYSIADAARGYERMGNPSLSHEGYAARETGSAIRDVFAKRSPETAAANADYSLFKTLNDVLDPVLGRPKAQTAPVGVTGGGRVTGAIVGRLAGGAWGAFLGGTVYPWLLDQMSSPKYQMVSAQKKLALAQAIRSGSQGAIRSAMARFGPAASAGGNILALPPGVPTLTGVGDQAPTAEPSVAK